MIEISSATLRAQILPRGATLAGLWATPHAHSLVLGAAESAAYPGHLDYFGALVGPVANRVKGAAIEIDGQLWTLEANEGTTSLHSGSQGLHALDWVVREVEEEAVTLRLELPHGFGGLPGHRWIEACYDVKVTSCLRLKITAGSDRTTVFNIAHHPYWNLSGTLTIAGHRLMVPAQHYLPVDAQTLPTGNIDPVAGTIYDFQASRIVAVDEPLDANLCLADTRRETPAHCATLAPPKGPVLSIFSTEPGLQIYNGTGLKQVPVALHDDRRLVACAGLALEPQGWPDAPNNPSFPSILFVPGEQYSQVTEYRFSH